VELLFEVKDSGCGINSDHRKKLFTPFFQADTRTTRKYGGTGINKAKKRVENKKKKKKKKNICLFVILGLGLAICQQLVRMFGGTINVESDVGKGSIFSFTVKLKAAASNMYLEYLFLFFSFLFFSFLLFSFLFFSFLFFSFLFFSFLFFSFLFFSFLFFVYYFFDVKKSSGAHRHLRKGSRSLK
jgi:K+-sensing histidine kinase KdpD